MSFLRVFGAKKVRGALNEAANLDDVKNVLKMNGAEMQANAQRNAPVDTGALKRFVVLYVYDDGFKVVVKSLAQYAPYQEYGTRFMTGTPHIRPAYYEQRKQFISDMKRLMK